MLQMTTTSQICLAVKPVDFRKQIDGLVAICRQFGQQPRDGKLYVFINRAHTRIKVLCYDGSGYWLALKRSSRGKFSCWPQQSATVTTVMAQELKLILKSTPGIGGDAHEQPTHH